MVTWTAEYYLSSNVKLHKKVVAILPKLFPTKCFNVAEVFKNNNFFVQSSGSVS